MLILALTEVLGMSGYHCRGFATHKKRKGVETPFRPNQ